MPVLYEWILGDGQVLNATPRLDDLTIERATQLESLSVVQCSMGLARTRQTRPRKYGIDRLHQTGFYPFIDCHQDLTPQTIGV